MTLDKSIPPEVITPIGASLQQARAKRALSIQECAKQTRVALRYLEALEAERWNDLPSESHRVGFLRLYSRFLGIPSEELIRQYLRTQNTLASVTQPSGPSPKPQSSATKALSVRPGWYPTSWIQLVGVAIVCLIVCWAVYHLIRRTIPDQRVLPIVRLRTHPTARLIPPATVSTHKMRVVAQADSWLRILSNNQLLFEGILPAYVSKEWTGLGPFHLKIGNVNGVTVFWNDQSVDIQSTARGRTNELSLPPNR